MVAVTTEIPANGPVVFPAPAVGWSPDAYRAVIREFIQARGHAPQRITMHPDTLGTVTNRVVRREAERVVDGLLTIVHREEQVLEQMRERVQQDADRADSREVNKEVNIETSLEHDRSTIVMT